LPSFHDYRVGKVKGKVQLNHFTFSFCHFQVVNGKVQWIVRPLKQCSQPLPAAPLLTPADPPAGKKVWPAHGHDKDMLDEGFLVHIEVFFNLYEKEWKVM
jgi:hypothetical protein